MDASIAAPDWSILPGTQRLLASQQEIPEPLRQCSVLLKFAQPVRRLWLGDFLRIQLSAAMRAAGEPEFYQASLWQPQRLKAPRCPRCQQPTSPAGRQLFRCLSTGCTTTDGRPSREQTLRSGPVRGVIRLVVADEFIVNRTQPAASTANPATTTDSPSATDELVDRVLLILDRRYDEAVRAAVWRAAAEIASEYGWKLVS